MINLLFIFAVLSGEAEEVERLASKYNGEVEVRLHDGSRVDLLTSTHAIEVDYSRKWAEGIGQSLHYSILTNRKPGLILLVKNPSKEWRSIQRASRVCGKYGIDIYIERVSE